MADEREMVHSARWKVTDDDGAETPYWYGYCDGDKDGDRLGYGEPLMMDPKHFPVGTHIDVIEPWSEEFYAAFAEERARDIQAPPQWEARMIFRMIKAARKSSDLLPTSESVNDWSDASRMAAAPDLLAACKEATEFTSWAEGQIRGLTQSLGSNYDRPPEIAEALAVLSAAIAKAEKGGPT